MGQKSYLLFDTFEDTFNANGHSIVNNIEEAEYAIYDTWVGCGNYDQSVIESIVRKNIPVAVMDFFDYNDTALWLGFNNWEDVLHQEWANNLRKFIDAGLVKAYFMRKMNKTLTYPKWVHPIECIRYPDHDFDVVSREELITRPYDICFIGTRSRERRSVLERLISFGFNVDFEFTQERIPHNEWLNRHRQSKFFLTADGGGFSDERAYQLIDIACMLKQKNNHFQLNPFSNLSHCVGVSEFPTYDEMKFLKEILDSNHNIYHIYEQARWWMERYYSPQARAAHVLTTILNNL